jgi:hypothetical protein
VTRRRTGRFFCGTVLPRDIDAKKVQATMKEGILTIRLPKTKQATGGSRSARRRSAEGASCGPGPEPGPSGCLSVTCELHAKAALALAVRVAVSHRSAGPSLRRLRARPVSSCGGSPTTSCRAWISRWHLRLRTPRIRKTAGRNFEYCLARQDRPDRAASPAYPKVLLPLGPQFSLPVSISLSPPDLTFAFANHIVSAGVTE